MKIEKITNEQFENVFRTKNQHGDLIQAVDDLEPNMVLKLSVPVDQKDYKRYIASVKYAISNACGAVKFRVDHDDQVLYVKKISLNPNVVEDESSRT